MNGNVVDVAMLDACNGLTSATPEFPSGAYHYVLPIDANGNPVTTTQSSLTCYSGTVNATLSAQMKQLACRMPMLLASGTLCLPDGREVTPSEARAWTQWTTGGMVMASAEAGGPFASDGSGTRPQTLASRCRRARCGT